MTPPLRWMHAALPKTRARRPGCGHHRQQTFAFVGLERMGGVLVFDITDAKTPKRVDYINTRENWTTAFGAATPRTGQGGRSGPRRLGLRSRQGFAQWQALLLVGNEVSGSTAIFQLNLAY